MNTKTTMNIKSIAVLVCTIFTALYPTATVSGTVAPGSADGHRPGRYIIQPFRIDVAPMERLLLINFEEDPDSVYIGFEPQVFDDTVNGRGHLVIGWRRDGYVDVYHQATLSPDPETYDITGKGLNRMIDAEFASAAFEVTATGVQASYRFSDIHGRVIQLEVAESNKRKRKPFGLLAPMGSAAESPSSMPLIMLEDFYFVRVRHTSITISIGGREHIPDRLAMPMDFRRMYFTRYSPRPLIATLNPAFDGPLVPIMVGTGEREAVADHHVIQTLQTDEGDAISRIIRNNDFHPVGIIFSPPFPDLASLQEGAVITGSFTIEGHPSIGTISGHYLVAREQHDITVEMVPSGGWSPRPDRLSLRLMYSMVKVFRQWPAEYRWQAKINQQDDGTLWMTSRWMKGDGLAAEEIL